MFTWEEAGHLRQMLLIVAWLLVALAVGVVSWLVVAFF
jgi:hypothetical protein